MTPSAQVMLSPIPVGLASQSPAPPPDPVIEVLLALADECVFERGVRGDDSTGSELGLFIARRLMADQGGSITVRPRGGGGRSFALQLRRSQ